MRWIIHLKFTVTVLVTTKKLLDFFDGPFLGQADIATEVSLLSRHLYLLRRGHIYKLFNTCEYLKKHPYSKIVINPDYMNVKCNFGKRFNEEEDWL